MNEALPFVPRELFMRCSRALPFLHEEGEFGAFRMREELVARLLAECLEVLHGAGIGRHHLQHLAGAEVTQRLFRAQDRKGTVEPANIELPVECLHRLCSPKDMNFIILKAGKPCATVPAPGKAGSPGRLGRRDGVRPRPASATYGGRGHRMQPTTPSFRDALRFWLKLGFISFGGPAGQISVMHKELVERRRWISERRFLHALNYCMVLPGPEAQQLATYIGWLLHRTWGGVVAGALFVLPSLFILIGLSWVYVAFGSVSWVAGLLYGIKPAVAAIVLHAVHRIGSKTLKKPTTAPLLWAIAASSFVAI